MQVSHEIERSTMGLKTWSAQVPRLISCLTADVSGEALQRCMIYL